MKCRRCGYDNCMIVTEEKPLEAWRIVCAVLLFPIGLLFLFIGRTHNISFCPHCGYKEEI